mgnify:CR=1 FL=1
MSQRVPQRVIIRVTQAGRGLERGLAAGALASGGLEAPEHPHENLDEHQNFSMIHGSNN